MTSDKLQVTNDKFAFMTHYVICFQIPWDSRSIIESIPSDKWQGTSDKWQITSLLLWPIMPYVFGFIVTPGVQ